MAEPILIQRILLTREHLMQRLNFVADIAGYRCLAGKDDKGTRADLVVECQPLAGSRPFGGRPAPLGSRFLTL